MEPSTSVLTLKYKDKTVSIFPPKSLTHLKYSINKLLNTRITPSSLIFIHNDRELTSSIYDSELKSGSFELSLHERETLITPFIYITTPKIYYFHHPYRVIESIQNQTIPWSAISFWLPGKDPVFITGNTHFEMDLSTHQIRSKAPMNFPRHYFASTVVVDHIYILGGVSIEGYSSICERYDTNTQEWEYIHPHLTPGKSGMTACQWANLKIYLFGGLDGMNYSSNIEVFNVEQSIWSLLPVTLPWETYYIAAAEAETGIIILGGKDNRECSYFDIGSLTFRTEGSLPASVECTKFIHPPKRYGNLLYFLSLDFSVLQFDCSSKKFEVLYDSKKNGVN
jgi:hypothetical protein